MRELSSLLDIFPIFALISLIGSLAVFGYLVYTESQAPTFSYVSSKFDNKRKPKVSIVVTAKNEEQMIKACVESLIHQTYLNFEIVVVDDSSTDSTPKIVSEIAARTENLRLIPAGEKPSGWVGKSWPCWRGFQEANGDYLLFVDADSLYERTVVELCALYMEKNSIDMFSLSPRVVTRGIWAPAVLPLITGAINLLYPMIKVNDRKSKRAYVFGTFFLIRREVYARTGGHSKVRDQLVEDAAVAQLVKSAGYNLRVERGTELLSTEWESDPKTIFDGLERITSSSIKNFGTISILNAVLLFVLIIYPPIFVLAGIYSSEYSPIFLVGLTASLVNIAVFLSLTAMEMREVSGKVRPAIFLYFLGALMFIIAIVTTSIKVARKKKLYWKGQGYFQSAGKSLENITEN